MIIIIRIIKKHEGTYKYLIVIDNQTLFLDSQFTVFFLYQKSAREWEQCFIPQGTQHWINVDSMSCR